MADTSTTSPVNLVPPVVEGGGGGLGRSFGGSSPAFTSQPFNLAGTAPAPIDIGLSPLPDFSATLNPNDLPLTPDRINNGPVSLAAPFAVNNTTNLASFGTAAPAPPPPVERAVLVSTNATNLPINETNYQIPFFLQSVLSTPAGSLPKGPLWVVTFENSFDTSAGAYIGNSGIPSIINKVDQYEPSIPKWNITKAIATICSDDFMKTKGCILTQNVTLPGEQIYHLAEGLQYNGFIRGAVGNGRQDYELLNIGFLNTNVSFVDNVIRPWVIMTGHLGMIARSGAQQYRTNITVRRLGVTDARQGPFIAQTFTFYGACPISVSSEDYTYDNENIVVKSASFVYQWYTVDSSHNVMARGNIGAGLSNRDLIIGNTGSRASNIQINPPASSTFPNAVTPYNLQ
jgi:hypothetical protein